MAISSRSVRRFATQHRFVSALSAGIGSLFFALLPAPARAVRLCSLPVVLPFEKGDERFDVVEEKVDAVFRSAGFEMTDSEAIVEVYERVDEEWGEIFDPMTGRIIQESQRRFTRALGDAYREELGCDALLRVSVVIVRAPYSTPTASWDGTKRQVVSTGRTILSFLAGQTEYGWVSALSIWIRLMNPEGEDIAFRSAGIEPLVELSFSRDLDKLPPDRWLRDEAFLDEAVESALGAEAGLLRFEGTSTGEIDDEFAWPES